MDTKLKSDIAESAVMTRLLKLGCRVLRPVGDRLPYDLCIDLDGKLVKIQVKSAWRQAGSYTVDSRRTKTNRRRMVRGKYGRVDFDLAVLYIEDLDAFYVMPQNEFNSYKSGITLSDERSRQRPSRAASFREAWHLLFQ